MNERISKTLDGDTLPIKVDHPVTSFVSVTSATAERWLTHNTHNRPLSDTAVYAYQSDMENGRFKLTGEPVQFSKTGVLLNGQNRLTALANCMPPLTIVFNVVRGLEDESQFYMDLVNRRSPGQQLGLMGVRNSRQVAAGARLFIQWEKDLLFTDQKRQRAISTPYLEQWVQTNSDLVDEFNDHLAYVCNRVGAMPAAASAFAFAGLRVDAQATVAFFHLWSARTNLPAGSPILALDNRFRNSRLSRERLSQRECLLYIIHGWNAWMRGESIIRVQAPRNGLCAENFPKMVTRRSAKFDWAQFQAGLAQAKIS
jgi:hypothetical protein